MYSTCDVHVRLRKHLVFLAANLGKEIPAFFELVTAPASKISIDAVHYMSKHLIYMCRRVNSSMLQYV